ncbi:MAG: 50S ribosomal protein L17 [Candidatus Neomarinimicrobiota bacterium]|tara:strand:- start:589 stop:1014 length:426 start_codon:yes stop_codon:yes gene_type:complete
MRKRISARKFGRSAAHRKALMSNLASSLIEHKRIKTTHEKALELRKFIEPMITKAKNHTVHNRREVLKRIHNDTAVKALFDVIAPSYADRPGGYTRIIKLGSRPNDSAKVSLIEFVDKFNFENDDIVDKTEEVEVVEESKE